MEPHPKRKRTPPRDMLTSPGRRRSLLSFNHWNNRVSDLEDISSAHQETDAHQVYNIMTRYLVKYGTRMASTGEWVGDLGGFSF